SFFAKSAENATQHIDFVFRRIFFFTVQMFFARKSFRSFHRNGFCRTSERAKSASRTVFATFFVTVQNVQSTKNRTEWPLFFRIIDCYFLSEKVFQRNPHPLEN